MNNFLTEDNGNKSSMRLMCLISLIAAIVFGLIAVYVPEPGSAAALSVCTTFVGAAFSGKVVQKFAETKITTEESKDKGEEDGK